MEEKQIDKRLKFFLKKINLSQRALARELDIPINTMHKYFTGSVLPSVPFLQKMHKRYGMNINWLLFGRGPVHDYDIIDDILIKDITTGYNNGSDRPQLRSPRDEEGYLSEQEMEYIGRLIRIMKRRKSVGRIIATLVEVNEEERST